jgi:CubicO group peptidase (beta-lactamase class C family)
MTKPITSVALMMMLERGHFHLDDAARHWIPELRKLVVYSADGHHKPLESDITIRQLLTHTAGFSYGFDPESIPVDREYEKIWGFDNHEKTMGELLAETFRIPLIAQPGTHWNYSIATDICGHLVELMSGKPLGDYMLENIFSPLGMQDTFFIVPDEKISRLATLYGIDGDETLAKLESEKNSPYYSLTPERKIRCQAGGSGLVSSATDYLRFARMMLNRGELDGTRIISRKTVEWMTTNHIPKKMLPLSYNGIVPQLLTAYGFGLGYCINIDPANAGTLGSKGDFGWGSLADSYCWVDPQENLVGILMQQFVPALHHAGRRDFRNAVYQALS